MTITTIFFDLGSTLIYSKEYWLPIFKRADRALLEALRHSGIAVTPASLYAGFDYFLDAYYTQRSTGTIEPTAFTSLNDALNRQGIRDVPEVVIREALEAMYAVTQENWYLEEDAILTLETLLRRGYRLGMISNTSDDTNVQKLVDRWGLRPYFEFIVTSAECGIRKPDKRIFRLALDHFKVSPEHAAMVGDTLEADILGANRMGMYSIWITRRAAGPDLVSGSAKSPSPIRPDATVKTLSEIPSILAARA